MDQFTCCQALERFSLFNAHFIFLDTGDYLARGLFRKHRVRVYFGDEFQDLGSPYRLIFCHVRKWDTGRFRAALRELPNKMLLCGNMDYPEACNDFWEDGTPLKWVTLPNKRGKRAK